MSTFVGINLLKGSKEFHDLQEWKINLNLYTSLFYCKVILYNVQVLVSETFPWCESEFAMGDTCTNTACSFRVFMIINTNVILHCQICMISFERGFE